MRYEIHVPSMNSDKVASAETAVRAFHQDNFGDKPVTVELNSRTFPSGTGTPRPEIPFSVGSLKSTLAAANARIAQMESVLPTQTQTDADVRLIIAQENGLKLGWGRNRNGRRSFGVYDHAVAVVKDISSNTTYSGVSSGARFPTWGFIRDAVRTAMKPGGFHDNTIAATYSERMARRGVEVDKQNPHPSLGYPARAVFLLEATHNAMGQLPTPRRN